jgi:nicotinate-nucleotide adenylyltransferase
MAQENIIVFGGSFNPVHIAHVFMACYLLSTHKPEKIIVIPVYKHAFGKQLESFEHRYEMCKIAMGWIPTVSISDIEKEIGEVSITAKTISLLKESNPNWNIKFVVGSDSADDLNSGKWQNSETLLQIAELLVIHRSNPSSLTKDVLPSISSSEIRASLKGQLPYAIAKTFLPLDVMKYIEEQNLYKPISYQETKI